MTIAQRGDRKRNAAIM